MDYKEVLKQRLRDRHEAVAHGNRLKHAFSPITCATVGGHKLLVSFDRFTRTYHVGMDNWLSDEVHHCADDAVKALQELVDQNLGWADQGPIPMELVKNMRLMEKTNNDD